MSEKQHPSNPWPPGVPRPGEHLWPRGAVSWLDDTFPGNHWRWRILAADHPWMLTVVIAAQLRGDIELLREQYRITARRWGHLLPPPVARRLLAATAEEGRRLQRMLEYVLALEHALSPTRPELKPEPTRDGDVQAAP